MYGSRFPGWNFRERDSRKKKIERKREILERSFGGPFPFGKRREALLLKKYPPLFSEKGKRKKPPPSGGTHLNMR